MSIPERFDIDEDLLDEHEDPVAVHLEGHGTFWWLKNRDGSGPLAPREHCTEVGELLFVPGMLEDSYAHVIASGTIKRYGKVIGHRNDLKVLPQ